MKIQRRLTSKMRKTPHQVSQKNPLTTVPNFRTINSQLPFSQEVIHHPCSTMAAAGPTRKHPRSNQRNHGLIGLHCLVLV